MLKRIGLLFLTLIILSSCKSSINLSETPIGLINNVIYKNSQYNKSNAANGFLVNHNKKTYAITAKHVLIIAKTPKMQFVDFEGELEEWKMHPKDDSSKMVTLDKLLNHNRTDSLTWSFMDKNWETFNDWLVFSVKENATDHKPLKFRTKPLVVGEKLFIVGWAYKDEGGPQRIYEYKYAKTDGDFYEIIQVNGPKSLGGLSGSPVVDENAQVVGLVSSGWEDEKTKETIVAATSCKNIVRFLDALKNGK